MAPELAKQLDCSSNKNEDFTIHLYFLNDYDDVKIYKPFQSLVNSRLDFGKRKKKQKNWGNKPHKKPEILTTYSMGLIKKNPQTILEKLGYKGIEVGVIEPAEDAEELKPEDVNNGRTYLGLNLESKPVYLVGKYNKYSRSLPQTPWFIEGVEIVRSSLKKFRRLTCLV